MGPLTLCRVPVRHNCEMVKSLLEGALIGAPGRGEAEANEELLHEHVRLVLSKGLMYVGTMPKGEAEGILAFVVPGEQCRVALHGIHRNAGHQGQQHKLALAQERFWWPMMVEDCHALVKAASNAVHSRGLYPRCLSALFGPTCCWSLSTWISQVWNPPWSSTSPPVSRMSSSSLTTSLITLWPW